MLRIRCCCINESFVWLLSLYDLIMTLELYNRWQRHTVHSWCVASMQRFTDDVPQVYYDTPVLGIHALSTLTGLTEGCVFICHAAAASEVLSAHRSSSDW